MDYKKKYLKYKFKYLNTKKILGGASDHVPENSEDRWKWMTQDEYDEYKKSAMVQGKWGDPLGVDTYHGNMESVRHAQLMKTLNAHGIVSTYSPLQPQNPLSQNPPPQTTNDSPDEVGQLPEKVSDEDGGTEIDNQGNFSVDVDEFLANTYSSKAAEGEAAEEARKKNDTFNMNNAHTGLPKDEKKWRPEIISLITVFAILMSIGAWWSR